MSNFSASIPASEMQASNDFLNNTAQTGAMNRMRETPKLSTEAKWRLAAAYAIAGYKDVAEKIVKSSSTVLKGGDYRYTFGSDLR